MSKLILIDGNAILHRAYHALPPLTTKTGEPINAVYGLVSMLLRVIQDLKPSHIIIAFDRPEPTFRQKEFADYQAQRPPLDKELSSQFSKAKDVASAMYIPVFEKAGYEADDLIGTIAMKVSRLSVLGSQLSDNSLSVISQSDKRTKKPKTKKPSSENRQQKTDIWEVIIVTGDRDILQLVNEKTKVYMPVKGMSEGKLFGIDEVKEKMGVGPEKIVDLKALVGDPSDNYKGVPGIGPKTAQNLLNAYGSFQGIYKNISKIPPSAQKKLMDGKESGMQSFKLAKIVTDVELDFDPEKASVWHVDGKPVLDLFAEFGFRTLTNRVKDVGKQIVSENQTSMF